MGPPRASRRVLGGGCAAWLYPTSPDVLEFVRVPAGAKRGAGVRDGPAAWIRPLVLAMRFSGWALHFGCPTGTGLRAANRIYTERGEAPPNLRSRDRFDEAPPPTKK